MNGPRIAVEALVQAREYIPNLNPKKIRQQLSKAVLKGQPVPHDGPYVAIKSIVGKTPVIFHVNADTGIVVAILVRP